MDFKDPAYYIPNQTEVAAEKFCLKKLITKAYRVGFAESHVQILHPLKIVYLFVLFIFILFSERIDATKPVSGKCIL